MPISITPRPMNPNERAAVDLILANDFPGAGQLRDQVDHVRVVATWDVDSASVDLEVLTETPYHVVGHRVVPVDASVVDESGSPFGEILLWVSNGHLSAIEYAWYGDEPPTELPNPSLISIKMQS